MKEILSYKCDAHCRKFTLVLSFMLLCLIGKSQFSFTELDKLLLTNQKQLGDNLAVLIYKDGKIIYQKQTGELTVRTKVPVEGCSKWLTAALIMTFVDEGKISLDERVSNYLPIFDRYGKPDITMRQCLSHQTGIADNKKLINKLLEMERNKFESLEAEVETYAKRETVAKPGTTFNYGNIGISIAGRVLEVISKKKFDVLAKQRIFTPLNMRSSSFTPEENSVNPSGGAVSTASDYMNFLIMILDKGVFMGKRILSEAAVKEMQSIETSNITKKYTPKGTEGYEYGLGEWIESKDGNGNSSVISCPELSGSWPIVDNCRKYACIFFSKTVSGEQKKDIYPVFKKLVDKSIGGDCK